MISIFLLWAACAVSAADCHALMEMKGVVPEAPGLAFGTEARFDNEIETITCSSVLRRGRPVACVQRLHVTTVGVVVERCIPNPPLRPVRDSEVHGSTSGYLDRLVVRGAAVSFVRLNLPGWSFVSSPVFCGDRIAYWAPIRNGNSFKVYLRVFDLGSRKLVANAFFRNDTLETDDSGYLPDIRWTEPGTDVVAGAFAVHVR